MTQPETIHSGADLLCCIPRRSFVDELGDLRQATRDRLLWLKWRLLREGEKPRRPEPLEVQAYRTQLRLLRERCEELIAENKRLRGEAS